MSEKSAINVSIKSSNPSNGKYQALSTNDVSPLVKNHSSSPDLDPLNSSICNLDGNTNDNHGKKLGLAGLVVLSYYTVCGGPFGVEDVVRAGGPLYALLGFGLLAVWAIPEAMITAELSVAMPESSGSVAWVDAAFGDFWAFQKGWLSWLSGVADNALYPILFLDCLLQLLTDDTGNNFLSGDDGTIRWALLLSITTFLTYFNYRGLEVVGRLAILICLMSLAPFVVFCIFGLPYVNPNKWFLSKPGGFTAVDWRLLLNTFFWNINFWESASSFSADVDNPSVNYPKGMFIAVALVLVSLLFPILIGIGASNEDYDNWTDGYFVRLATNIVGPWLGVWMTLAAMITNIGMFEAEMSSDAWQIAGMADKGILPSFLGKRNRYDSPTYGILLSATGVICLGWLAFSEVIDMLNLLYCYAQLIEFAAYLRLRYVQGRINPEATYLETVQTNSNQSNHPNLPKYIKFYFSSSVMTGLLVMPIVFIFIILSLSSRVSLIISIALSLSGVGMYYLLGFMKQKKWFHFNDYEHITNDSNQSLQSPNIYQIVRNNIKS